MHHDVHDVHGVHDIHDAYDVHTFHCINAVHDVHDVTGYTKPLHDDETWFLRTKEALSDVNPTLNYRYETADLATGQLKVKHTTFSCLHEAHHIVMAA